MDEPREHDGRQLCGPCHTKILEAEARKAREADERRRVEEEARAKLEDRRRFGSDPRYED